MNGISRWYAGVSPSGQCQIARTSVLKKFIGAVCVVSIWTGSSKIMAGAGVLTTGGASTSTSIASSSILSAATQSLPALSNVYTAVDPTFLALNQMVSASTSVALEATGSGVGVSLLGKSIGLFKATMLGTCTSIVGIASPLAVTGFGIVIGCSLWYAAHNCKAIVDRKARLPFVVFQLASRGICWAASDKMMVDRLMYWQKKGFGRVLLDDTRYREMTVIVAKYIAETLLRNKGKVCTGLLLSAFLLSPRTLLPYQKDSFSLSVHNDQGVDTRKKWWQKSRHKYALLYSILWGSLSAYAQSKPLLKQDPVDEKAMGKLIDFLIEPSPEKFGSHIELFHFDVEAPERTKNTTGLYSKSIQACSEGKFEHSRDLFRKNRWYQYPRQMQGLSAEFTSHNRAVKSAHPTQIFIRSGSECNAADMIEMGVAPEKMDNVFHNFINLLRQKVQNNEEAYVGTEGGKIIYSMNTIETENYGRYQCIRRVDKATIRCFSGEGFHWWQEQDHLNGREVTSNAGVLFEPVNDLSEMDWYADQIRG